MGKQSVFLRIMGPQHESQTVTVLSNFAWLLMIKDGLFVFKKNTFLLFV